MGRRRIYSEEEWIIKKAETRKKELEKSRLAARERRKNKPDEVRKYLRDYMRDRKNRDSNFRLISCLRSHISKKIKSQLTTNDLKTNDLLGCTIDEFKIHLEMQFKEGMSWNNYGLGENKWNIDHIKPCAAFDLSDPEQVKKCFHYSNMQPLWTLENKSKRSSFEGKSYSHKKD